MDKQRLKRYLDSFSKITGLKIALIDKRFRGIIVCGYEIGKYCDILHSSQKCLKACIDSNGDAFKSAKESGNPYVYRCPFGLEEITVPIIEGDTAVGYLIAGPILESSEKNNEFLIHQLTENGIDAKKAKAEDAIDKILVCSAESVRSLCDMLSLIAEHIALDGIMRDSEKTIGQLVKDYVKRNLSRKITLAELSLYANCSTVTLTKHFKQEFGMSIMEYVAKKRLLLSEKLLLETKLSVTDIADHCGFCNTEYFSRCFKQVYGISPVNYRKKMLRK